MKHHPQAISNAPSTGVERTKRSANGVSEKPVALRLLPEERERLERGAKAAKVSMAKLAADYFRAGIAATQMQPRKAAKASAK